MVRRSHVLIVLTHADLLTKRQRLTVLNAVQTGLEKGNLYHILSLQTVTDSDEDSVYKADISPPAPYLVFTPEEFENYKRIYPVMELDCLDERVSDLARLYGELLMAQNKASPELRSRSRSLY